MLRYRAIARCRWQAGEEIHGQPQNSCRWPQAALPCPVGCGPAYGRRKGRALCECRRRSHALRGRCAGGAEPRESVKLPAGVQYAWPHASRRYLYVATSSSAPGYGTAGTEHHVTAFAIDPASGALTPHGEPIRLPTRPIHMSTDIPSENILVAFNNPSAVRVYRINKDFTPGEEVKQPGPIDAGIFAHQVRVTPDNRAGDSGDPRQRRHAAQGGRPGRAESLRIQERRADERGVGRAERRQGIRPAPPRFPPDQAVDVCLDRDAEQDVHVSDGGRQDQSRSRLQRRHAGRAEQHPGAAGGRHGARPPQRPLSYTAPTAPRQTELSGQAGLQGRRKQHRRVCDQSVHRRADSRSSTSRLKRSTRAPSTSTRAAVCWSRSTICRSMCATASDQDGPAGLSVFRIGDDGKLTFVRKYDIDVGDKTMFWMGMVPLPT